MKILINSKLALFGFLLFLTGLSVQAQEPALLKGNIRANNPNIEKIHVINLNLEKGAVTNKIGEFQILARKNDSLYISSVQFQNRTIVVSQKMLDDNAVIIELLDAVNELAEVIVDDIQLSGYLANDLTQISTKDLEQKYELQNSLNAFIEKDRELNPYEKPVLNGGVRLDLIAGMVIDKLSSDSKKAPKVYSDKELANKSIQLVGHEFFREDLKLNENEICNFLYFCADDNRFKHLVINDKAFVLIEYFQTRIEQFKDRRGDILNAPSQIPG